MHVCQKLWKSVDKGQSCGNNKKGEVFLVHSVENVSALVKTVSSLINLQRQTDSRYKYGHRKLCLVAVRRRNALWESVRAADWRMDGRTALEMPLGIDPASINYTPLLVFRWSAWPLATGAAPSRTWTETVRAELRPLGPTQWVKHDIALILLLSLTVLLVISPASFYVYERYCRLLLHAPTGGPITHCHASCLSVCLSRNFARLVIHLRKDTENLDLVEMLFWGTSNLVIGHRSRSRSPGHAKRKYKIVFTSALA